MKLSKFYSFAEINLHLLPDFMEQVKASLPESALLEPNGKALVLHRSFHLRTASHVAFTDDSEEFRDILRATEEPPVAVRASLDCHFKEKHLRQHKSEPPALLLELAHDAIAVSIARNTATSIRNLFSTLEETFSLQPVQPPSEDKETIGERERTIFIAHSFDQEGKSYAYELVKLLNLLHFQVSTGEGYSPEGVSSKVKRRLLAQEVVIAILSRKEDAAWLTQEAAGATFTNKPLIIALAEGVDFNPGVLGDLEYIRFPAGQISATFVPLLEGLREIGYRIG